MQIGYIKASDVREGYLLAVGGGEPVVSMEIFQGVDFGAMAPEPVAWANIRTESGNVLTCLPDAPVGVVMTSDGFQVAGVPDVEEALDVVRLLADARDALIEASNNLDAARDKVEDMPGVPGALIYLLAAMQEKMPGLVAGGTAATDRMEIVAGKAPKA